VPGLLQTEDYARTVIRANKPGVDDAAIEQRSPPNGPANPAHQGHLPPFLQMVLNEAIVRRPVGAEK
jgi:hypothetical protein